MSNQHWMRTNVPKMILCPQELLIELQNYIIIKLITCTIKTVHNKILWWVLNVDHTFLFRKYVSFPCRPQPTNTSNIPTSSKMVTKSKHQNISDINHVKSINRLLYLVSEISNAERRTKLSWKEVKTSNFQWVKNRLSFFHWL